MGGCVDAGRLRDHAFFVFGYGSTPSLWLAPCFPRFLTLLDVVAYLLSASRSSLAHGLWATSRGPDTQARRTVRGLIR
jgi:hypothetical protein